MRTLVAGGLTLRRQRRRQHVVFKGNPFQSLPTQESALKRERPVSGAGSICKRARCRFHISPLPALREPGADRGLPGRRRSLRSFLLWNLRLFRNRDAARAVKKARFFPACAGAHISLPNLAPCGLSWDSSRSRRSSGYFSPLLLRNLSLMLKAAPFLRGRLVRKRGFHAAAAVPCFRGARRRS